MLQSVAGEAPFTVHAHGLTSDLRVGTPISARYEWNFGDPDGAYNTLVGFNAAHVYDAPGVYTVTLKVINEAGKAALVGDGPAQWRPGRANPRCWAPRARAQPRSEAKPSGANGIGRFLSGDRKVAIRTPEAGKSC